MRVRPIGEVIRAQRLKLGLTQEQLCEGICEPITLSRLETGKHSLSHNRLKALLQRLDLPDDRYRALLDEEELELEDLKREATAQNALFWDAAAQNAPKLWEEALEAVRALEDFGGDDPMVRQYAAGLRASLGTPDGPYSLEKTLSMLLDAIRITRPQFDLENINALQYSVDEMSLIFHIANAYAMAGRRQEAIAIYEQLVEYARQHQWERPRYAGQLALLLSNYARELSMDGQYEKTVEISKLGWEVCVKYMKYSYLGVLLALRANAYARLGQREQSRELYYQTYYLYKALGDTDGLAHLRNDAKDTLELKLD